MDESATDDARRETTEESEGGGLSRRTLLIAAGIAGGAAGVGVFSCVDRFGSDGWIDLAGGPEHLPFDVWEEIQEVLRTSPDHLPAQAESLAAEGDTEEIFRLVRDRVATLPCGTHDMGRFGAITTAMRWGPDGTLRSGAGTPREKAELLAQIYRQAGYEATVMDGGPGFDRDGGRRVVLRPPERPFAPDVSEDRIQDWHQRLGLEPGAGADEPVPEGVLEGEPARRLAGSVIAGLPEDRRSPYEFDWRSGGSAPLVRVETPEETLWADLFGDGGLGESPVDPGRLEEAEPADELDRLRITLSASTADAPNEPFELLTGTFSIGDLVGRQLFVHTLPGVQPLDRPDVRFADIQTFIPSLTVQGARASAEELGELTTIGHPFTIRGERLEVDDAGSIARGDGVTIAADPDADPAAVATLEASADPGRFPAVRLALHALDVDGVPVEGLPGSAFRVTDGGEPVVPTLVRNTVSPRIHVLYDTSASMPGHYSGEQMRAFVDALRQDVLELEPDARVTLARTNSDLWTHLADAAAGAFDLILFATDGHVNDERTPELALAIESGPPAVLLDVNRAPDEEVRSEAMIQMAELSAGRAIPADDQEATRVALGDYLAEVLAGVPGYVMEYRAPEAGGPERRVEIEMPEGAAGAQTSYTAPERGRRPLELAGLYLTVQLLKRAGDPQVTRTLAGWDPVADRGEPAGWEHVEEVAGALFGNTVLSVEGAGVPFSVWADDILESRLSLRELDSAVSSGSVAEARERLDEGFLGLALEPMLLNGPIPEAVTEETHTFPSTVRVTLYHERPEFGTDRAHKKVDVLPITVWSTAGESAERCFRTTLERTARIAVLERALFDESTASLLGGRRLGTSLSEEVERSRRDEFDRLIDRHGARGRRYRVLPVDGGVLAYWSVDSRTGQMLGVLPDASGGGRAEARMRASLGRLDRAISVYNLYIGAAGASGAVSAAGAFSLGVVAAYGQVLARLYAAVSLTLTVMDVSGLSAAQRSAMAGLACEVAKAIFLASITSKTVVGRELADKTGVVSEAMSIVENLIGAMGGSTPTSCSL